MPTWSPEDIADATKDGVPDLLGEKSRRAIGKEFIPSENPGPKPLQQWTAKDRFFIPIEFQRLVNRHHVGAILSEYNNGFVHAVHCGPEEERGYPIIDGQHEWLAAMQHPLVDEMPTLVAFWADTRAKQAEIFVRLNQVRINITQTGIFYARVTQGDEEAVWMNDVLSSAGCQMSRVMTGNLPPLMTCAIGTIRRLRSLDEYLRRALDVMARAWPTQTGAFQAPMIEAVTKFIALHDKRLDSTRLHTVLVRLSSYAEVAKAKRVSPEFNQAAWVFLLAVLTKKYNDGMSAPKQLVPTLWSGASLTK